jgi:hypothetical protein
VGEPTTLKMASSCYISALPWNIASPKTSYAKMHPIDHMSISVEYRVGPNNSYGALYHKLMTYCVIMPDETLLAKPKSHIFSIPSFE